jgi:phytol kinase
MRPIAPLDRPAGSGDGRGLVDRNDSIDCRGGTAFRRRRVETGNGQNRLPVEAGLPTTVPVTIAATAIIVRKPRVRPDSANLPVLLVDHHFGFDVASGERVRRSRPIDSGSRFRKWDWSWTRHVLTVPGNVLRFGCRWVGVLVMSDRPWDSSMTRASGLNSANRSALSGDVSATATSAADRAPAVLPRPAAVSLSPTIPKGLTASEVRRRTLHILPGFLPFILWPIPHRDPWGPILADTVVAITVVIVGLGLLRFRQFARPQERDGRSAILGYAFPVLLTLSLCRGREELGLMTLAILAFGDGLATLGGLWLGGVPLPWNRKKTWTGLLCFLVCGATMSTIIFWGESRPIVSWLEAALVAGAATLAAGLIESFPSRGNDNLRVGCTAAVVGALMHYSGCAHQLALVAG